MILQDILDQAGVTVRKVPGSQYEVKLQCPFCFDDRFIFGLNLQNGWAHCFHCGYKSGSITKTIRDLCDVWQITYDLHAGILEAEETVSGKCPENVRATPVPIGLPAEYENFSADPDPIEEAARAYLNIRGVIPSQIQQHCIGFAGAGKFAWRVLFPVFGDDGEVYGTVGRDFSGQQKPKYLNTPNCRIAWNACRLSSTAVVCEGIMDALAVERALDSEVCTAISLLGCSATPVQLRQLSRFSRIVIFPDFDVAGIHGAIHLAEACRNFGISAVYIIQPPVLDGNDPGSLSPDVIAALFEAAKTWSACTAWRLRALTA